MKQTTKESIELSGIERKKSNLEIAVDCLEWVSLDFQLDPFHEEYLGYINIDPQDFIQPEWQEFFSTLHVTKNYFSVVFDHFGLKINKASQKEIIISKY